MMKQRILIWIKVCPYMAYFADEHPTHHQNIRYVKSSVVQAFWSCIGGVSCLRVALPNIQVPTRDDWS